MAKQTRYRFPESDIALAFPEARMTEIVDAGVEYRYGPDYIERNGERVYTRGPFEKICKKLAGVPESLVPILGEVYALPPNSGIPASLDLPVPVLTEPLVINSDSRTREGGEARESTEEQAATDQLADSRGGQNLPIEMTVLRTVLNTKMLLARGEGEEVNHVQVGDSTNFIPGMKLKAVRHPTETAFWKLVGPLPRDRGRW